MSRYTSLRSPGAPERSHEIPAIARNVSSMIIAVPAASPSIPSVRLAPLTVPAMTRKKGVEEDAEIDVPTGERT